MLDQRFVHSWLPRKNIAASTGPLTPLLRTVLDGLLDSCRAWGHSAQSQPDEETDLILTTAPLGKPLSWREALWLTVKRRWRLRRTPALYTLMHIRPRELEEIVARFEAALAKTVPDPADFDFPGLAPGAYRILAENGKRGGPIACLMRLLQAQTICSRIVLVVGEESPIGAYLFDLVGAHPWLPADDNAAFYERIVLRMVTSISAREVAEHEVAGAPLDRALWDTLAAPRAMRLASRELAKRRFFAPMIQVNELVKVPAVNDVIKSQYSEGCFATWEPEIEALITTVTGSARPVDKGNLTDDDLVVVTGVKPDGTGALLRKVEGKHNDIPTCEAVEMMEIDKPLPRVRPIRDRGEEKGLPAPVIRSKLHGHRGVAAYDPHLVEHVHLDPPYYDFPVSCGSDAQARALAAAFSRSEALCNPDDPRQIVFTILPGHGVVIVEKWVRGKAPFQAILEAMDRGCLEVTPYVPQGRLAYRPGPDGRMQLREDGKAAAACSG